MYWNNPVIYATVQSGPDVIESAQHQHNHCLFFDPRVPVTSMKKLLSLQDTCDLANQYIGCFDCVVQPGDIDKIANIVRINQYVHSLQQHGNFKPMLLTFTGSWPLGANTGGSRVMAAERIPGLESFAAFVSTHRRYQDQFQHLQEITTLAQFADHCGAGLHTQFVFRLTDATADYGIDWYEVALETTTVPSNQQCISWLVNYLSQQPKCFEFTPQWFDQEIDWTVFDHQ